MYDIVLPLSKMKFSDASTDFMLNNGICLVVHYKFKVMK